MLLFFDHPPSTSAKQELLAARVTVWQKAECQVRRKRQTDIFKVEKTGRTKTKRDRD